MSDAQERIEELETQLKHWRRNSRETFDAMCAMRDSINEHIPMPSLESVLLHGPESSVFCETVANAVAAQLAKVTAELADAEANINLKADWIDATLNDMAGEHEVIETYRAAIPVAYQMALDGTFKDMKTFAPHEEHNTGPEHDIGYASGYHTAMNRIRALTPPADLVEQATAKVKETK